MITEKKTAYDTKDAPPVHERGGSMENPVIDHFHRILSLMPIQDLGGLYSEILRLQKEGVSLRDITWRMVGAVVYVYECRTEGHDPETGRRCPDEEQM